MKEQAIQFIMRTFQWCCQSEVCCLAFRLWTYAIALVAFWGMFELIFFALGKADGGGKVLDVPADVKPILEPEPTPMSVKRVAPNKPKKTPAKKKSVKKKSKK